MNKIKAKDIIIFSIMLVLVLGLTVVVLLGVIPFKYTVEKELDGLKFQKEAAIEEAEHVTANIKIRYTNYILEWWNKDELQGEIILPDISDREWLFSGFYREHGDTGNYIDYLGQSHSEYEMRMEYNEEFSKYFIQGKSVYDEGTGYSMYYVFPAADVDEAIANAEEFFRDFSIYVLPNKNLNVS